MVLCAGTSAEVKVALDVHIMDDSQGVYDLLIGTPAINALGGRICAFESTFTYHPELHLPGGNPHLIHSIPISTFTDVAAPAYKESSNFLLGAVMEWSSSVG